MIETAAVSRTYWDEMARLYWLTGAPLRPSGKDILLLRWPERSRLLAVDGSFAMVKGVWPCDLPVARVAVCGAWSSLPVASQSFDVITGDGSANCVSFPEGLQKLAEEAHRVLRPGGCLLLRCYTRPDFKKEPQRVLAGLWDGCYSSFHDFKFRFLMSMQETVHRGVAVAEVHRRWVKSGIDPEHLASVTGWDPSVIGALDAYRDSSTVHFFPTLAEFRSVLTEYFKEIACSHATYPLAERCPLVFRTP